MICGICFISILSACILVCINTTANIKGRVQNWLSNTFNYLYKQLLQFYCCLFWSHPCLYLCIFIVFRYFNFFAIIYFNIYYYLFYIFAFKFFKCNKYLLGNYVCQCLSTRTKKSQDLIYLWTMHITHLPIPL